MTSFKYTDQLVQARSFELGADYTTDVIGLAVELDSNGRVILASAGDMIVGCIVKVEFRGSEAEGDTINWSRILKTGRVVSVGYHGFTRVAVAGAAIAGLGSLLVPDGSSKWIAATNANRHLSRAVNWGSPTAANQKFIMQLL